MAKVSKSILQKGDPRCFFCGRTVNLERHHIMPGANRKWSEAYGLWVWCCHEDHTGKDGVQYNRAKADSLKRLAQIAFEARHSHDEWMEIFGRNYI
jgi:hypothetical protein